MESADDEGLLLERLRAERTNPELYERLGDHYAGDARLVDKALRNYLEAARLWLAAPGSERAARAASACRVLEKAANLAPDRDPVLFRLAEALEAAGRPPEAEAVYRDLLSRSQEEQRPFFHLALLERIATLAPGDLAHRRLAAETRERLGMKASAARDLAEVARIEAREGHSERALADAERALKLLPGSAELTEARAEVADLLGDREGAARAWLSAAELWRRAGDEARGRLAAEHALSPGDARPLGADEPQGSALLLLADPLLLAHAESFALGVGLSPLRARSSGIATLPANLRIALVQTAALGESAAWDAVVELKAAAHAELPVVVIASDEHPLGEEDRAMLRQAGVPILEPGEPFTSLARHLADAVSAPLGPGNAARDEPLLPFDDLPAEPVHEPAAPSPAAPASLEEFELRFPQIAAFIRALKADAVQRDGEIEVLREAAEAARQALAAREEDAARETESRQRSGEAERLQSDRLRRENEDLAARLEAQRRMVERSREEAEERRRQIHRLETELQVEHQQAEGRASRTAQLQNQLDELRGELDAARRRGDELDQERQQLKAEAEAARRYAHSRVEIERERDAARSELEASRAALSRSELELAQERQSAAARREERRALAEQLESERREAEGARRELLDRLAAERRRIDSLEERRAAAELAVEDLRRELAAGRGELERAERRREEEETRARARELELAGEWTRSLETLRAERLELEERGRILERDLEAERSALAEALTALGRERAERARESAERQAERMRLEEAGSAREAEAAALRERLASERTLRAEHERSSTEQLGTLARQERELSALQLRTDTAESETAALRATLAGAIADQARARSEAELHAAAREALSRRLDELLASLNEEKSARVQAEGLVARREAESADTFLRLNRSEEERQALSARLEEREASLAETLRQLGRVQGERDAGLEDGRRERERAAALAAELEGSETRGAAAERAHAQSVGEARRLEGELEAQSRLVESLEGTRGRLDGEVFALRAELSERARALAAASEENARHREAAALQARRGRLLRMIEAASPAHPLLAGLFSGLLAVALFLGLSRMLERPAARRVASSPDLELPTPIELATPRETGMEPAATAAAGPDVELPGPSGPIELKDDVAVEQRLVRRAERSGYRLTAKFRTPEEVRAALAYQATVRGWGREVLAEELAAALGEGATAFRFDRRSHIDVLIENLGFAGPFDVNSLTSAFSLASAAGAAPASVSQREEPKVVSSSTEGAARIEAVTLSLEFQLPSALPAELYFRPLGAEPVVLRFEPTS